MDIYRKLKPDASEKKLVLTGRLSTAAIVILSLVWIPMIRLLSNQLYQYLQSIQAYVGAPITAVFLTGIFWKRATGKAALTTLITGGLLGIIRFVFDILGKMDNPIYGPLIFSPKLAFLNYATIIFVFCVALMIVISIITTKPGREKIANLTFSPTTMSAGIEKSWVWIHLVLSIVAIGTVVLIWAHFA